MLAVNIEVAPLVAQVTLCYIQCKVEIRSVTTLSIDILLLHITSVLWIKSESATLDYDISTKLNLTNILSVLSSLLEGQQ